MPSAPEECREPSGKCQRIVREFHIVWRVVHPAVCKWYSYHACTSVTVSGGVGMQLYMIRNHIRHNRLLLNTCMDTNIQFTINSFRQLFHGKIVFLTIPWFSVKSLIFPWQLSNSLTFPGFPDKWSPWIRDPPMQSAGGDETSLTFQLELVPLFCIELLADNCLDFLSQSGKVDQTYFQTKITEWLWRPIKVTVDGTIP